MVVKRPATPPPGRERLVFSPVSHTYEFDGMRVPGVTTVLKLIDGMEGVPPDRLLVAGMRGTAVHTATEEHDLGLPIKVASDPVVWGVVEPYVTAYLQFLSDHRDTLVIEDVEERVYHPLYQYAGTADRVALLAGERAVIDIKTSSKLNPAVGPQLAAYQEALNAHRTAKKRVTTRYALQLKKDATYVLKPYWESDDFAVFRACLEVYRWRMAKGLGELVRPSGVTLASGYELTDGGWPLRPVQGEKETPLSQDEPEPTPITLYGRKPLAERK